MSDETLTQDQLREILGDQLLGDLSGTMGGSGSSGGLGGLLGNFFTGGAADSLLGAGLGCFPTFESHRVFCWQRKAPKT